MKALFVVSLVLLGLGCRPLAAQEAPALGEYHFSFGFGPMIMQHVTFETDDAGVHLGLAGYKHVGRGWYLGAELGFGQSMVLFGDDSGITMYELNGKRGFELGGAFAADLGAGLSYNHVTYERSSLFGTGSDPGIDDWVLGIQGLAGIHGRLGPFLLGAYLKAMLTQDVDGVQEAEGLQEGWDYSNLTFGIRFGFLIR